MTEVEVTIVGGPRDGERWVVQGDPDGAVPQFWHIHMIDPVPAAYTSEGSAAPSQSVMTKVYAVPIRLTREGWIADWYAGRML